MTTADVATSDAPAGRSLMTPEGVPLTVELAGRADRAVAFLIDFLVILASVVVVLVVVAVVVVGTFEVAWAASFGLLAWFLIRTFYFTFFELRWQGRTPGKRALRLRVIDRDGGPLSVDAVVVRNFMREVEVFLPLWLLVATTVADWVAIASSVWIGIMALMPLFNRDRLRVGDIVAGTWVIAVPRTTLLADLADAKEPESEGIALSATSPAIAFTAAQLDTYGIYELQMLEEALRGEDGPRTAEALREISARIRRKTGWTPPAGTPEVAARNFLEAYYLALRGHLEKRMLLGERRETKHYGTHDRERNG